MNKVTYVSNAGVLLEIEGKKILIDSLCKSTVPIYKDTPEDDKEKIINGLPPFDDIDLMLVTHHHSDHFEAKSVADFFQHNESAMFISTPETVKRLKQEEPSLSGSRILAPTLQLGEREALEYKGITIQAIFMMHDGKDYRDVENFAYLIEVHGICVLHPGDAKPMEENFNHPVLVGKSINLFLAPFPYVGIPSGQGVIEKLVKPQKIAAIHLPYQELDQFNWIKGTKKSYARIKDRFVETIFLEESGDSLIF